MNAPSERKSNGAISKLAMQTSTFYQDAYRQLVSYNAPDKSWLAIAQAKMAFYEADAQYRTGMCIIVLVSRPMTLN